MAHNRYFIINPDDPNIKQIEEVIVGSEDKQRYSLDMSQMVIKLKEGDHNNYPFFSGYIEYNHDEILDKIASDAWQNNSEV